MTDFSQYRFNSTLMIILSIISAIVLLNVICIMMMSYKFFRHNQESLSFSQYIKLSISGLIAFIADTLGVGSFAVNISLAKLLGTFKDEELPAVNNGAQILPGMIEALFFIYLIGVDLKTLIVLASGACLGGLIGGFLVCYLGRQAIRLSMLSCFAFLIALLVAHKEMMFSLDGSVLYLHSWSLFMGFCGMIICGALTSVGIGLFVMVQALLFMLNMSPLVAFPIMTVAGALQQPLTTMVFLQKNKIPLKRTLVLSLSGCLGVAISIPLFRHLAFNHLHSLLLFILSYNFIVIGRGYLRERNNAPSFGSMRSLVAVD